MAAAGLQIIPTTFFSKTGPIPDPDIMAAEILEGLQAALAQFAAVTRLKERPGFPIASDLKKQPVYSVERPRSKAAFFPAS
jgi:hypothetical protein